MLNGILRVVVSCAAALALAAPAEAHDLWVHMVPAAADSGADWESIWASLTFELTPAGSVSQ